MENTKRIKIVLQKNLSEIKKFTYTDEEKLKIILENAPSEQLKEYLAEYNQIESPSFKEFIEVNDSKFLIDWIFSMEIK